MATTVFPSLDVNSFALVLGRDHRRRVPRPRRLGAPARPAPGAAPQLGAAKAAEAEAEVSARDLADAAARPAAATHVVAGRTVAMWTLRVYLVAAVLLLIVKAVQLGTGH